MTSTDIRQSGGRTTFTGQFVSDVMDRGVLSLPANATLLEAVQIMADEGVPLALVEAGGHAIGCISTHQLAALPHLDGDRPVSSLCTPPPPPVAPDVDLGAAARLMHDAGASFLIVEHEGETVAVLTLDALHQTRPHFGTPPTAR